MRGKCCAGGADHHPPHLSDQSRCPLLNAGSQNVNAAPQVAHGAVATDLGAAAAVDVMAVACVVPLRRRGSTWRPDRQCVTGWSTRRRYFTTCVTTDVGTTNRAYERIKNENNDGNNYDVTVQWLEGLFWF